MSFIGIDLGGTFIKGAILDVEAIQLQHIRRVPFPGFEPGNIYDRVVSSEKVLREFYRLLDELLSLTRSCDGILLCGQMHGLVFCDAKGQPYSDIITWQDQRALQPEGGDNQSYFVKLKNMLKNWDLPALGNEFRAGLPLTQLFLLEQMNALPERLYPASLMDLVAANLCGTAPITDPTNAEAHGLYDLIKNDWDYPLIKILRFDKLLWPEIKPNFSIVGTFNRNGRDIPCYVSIGDQQCAILGSFLEERELSFNIATGSQVSLLSDTCEFGDHQIRPYFEDRYLKTITHIPAGRALNALIGLFTEISGNSISIDQAWSYISEQVERTPTTNLNVSTTFNNSPLGDHGHISNMDESNMTIGHVFLAAFEDMARNYHTCATRLSPNGEWDRIVFSGGLAAKHPTLQRAIIREMNDVPFRINSNQEDVLTGLLVIATKIATGMPSLRDASNAVRTINTQH